VGVKAQLADRRVSLDGAVFDYDYKDMQIRGKLLNPIFEILDALVNVPRSRVRGLDGNATYRPFNGLTVTAAVTYLDSKVETYGGVNIIGLQQNFSGVSLPFSSKWSGLVDAEYRLSRANGGSPFLGFTVNSRSATDAALAGADITYPLTNTNRLAPGIVHPFAIDAYTTMDVRVGYETADRRWKVIFWGKNILDRYYWTDVIAASDSTFRLAGMPATCGVSFGYKYR
jgi:iron complex outermembrane recepter protein